MRPKRPELAFQFADHVSGASLVDLRRHLGRADVRLAVGMLKEESDIVLISRVGH